MSESPLVSVVMTAYNTEAFIAETVKSVISQSFTDFEFLIIDDCSSDKSANIIKSFDDERIKLIQKKENNGFNGYVENLNKLQEISQGKYIARIDADDIWHTDKLKKQIEFLEANPEISVTGCNRANKIDKDGKTTGIIDLMPNNQKFEDYILKKTPILNPSIVFRKNLDTKYRWKLYYCEDYDFHLINHSKKIPYHISDEIMMDYRVLANSMSHTGRVLIRALFVNQAKVFYQQRIANNGKDHYENFNPEDISNILDPEYKNELGLLLSALKISFIADLKNDFEIILKKIKTQYGDSKIPFVYRLFSFNFNFFQKIYRLKR